MARVMIVEDNHKIQAHLALLLRNEGHKVQGVATGEEAFQLIAGDSRETFDLLLVDIRLPGVSGLDLITSLRRHTLPPTIVISGEATITEAVEALKLGVTDFIEKPFTDERLVVSVKNCLEKASLQRQVHELERCLRPDVDFVGESQPIRSLLGQIEKLAPTNVRVLIMGESGTGKELVANSIHRMSKRADKPLVKINCASFPVHLIEDELFGHVTGAFTDARESKQGLFEEANGGTLFLDEIGDMDFALQSRFLRVLEDGRVRRIGGNRDVQVDVRVIAATNKDLQRLISENRFREDLFYRLSNVPVIVPPLRDRREDVPRLVSHFMTSFCLMHQVRRKRIEPEVHDALLRYSWPGNVRELRNLCERLVVFAGDPIVLDDLPSSLFHGGARGEGGILRISEIQPMPWKSFKAAAEKEYLEAMLMRLNWNYVKTAEALEMNRSYLHTKITTLQIQRGGKNTVVAADF